MTFLAPWVLSGLALVAVPVLIHWLARHEAVRQLFPALRFLVKTPPTSVRRHRLTDVPLLLVRAALVAALAATLAQPVLRTPPAGAVVMRAIVVDTSASLARRLADGRSGHDVAQTHVADLLREAPDALVLRVEDLAEGLRRAGAWLAAQPGTRAVTVISDFQAGALTEDDFTPLPAGTGRQFVAVPVSGPVPPGSATARVRVVGAPVAEGAARAALAEGTPGAVPSASDDTPEVLIAFTASADGRAAAANAQPISTLGQWVIGRGVGLPVWAHPTDPRGVLVVSDAAPDSVEAATRIAVAMRAAAEPSTPVRERDEATLAPEARAALERPASAPTGDAAGGTPRSLVRWGWALVLALLGLETWMRRRRPAQTQEQEVAHARVA